MQHNKVHMRLIYVNMQHNYVGGQMYDNIPFLFLDCAKEDSVNDWKFHWPLLIPV